MLYLLAKGHQPLGALRELDIGKPPNTKAHLASVWWASRGFSVAQRYEGCQRPWVLCRGVGGGRVRDRRGNSHQMPTLEEGSRIGLRALTSSDKFVENKTNSS